MHSNSRDVGTDELFRAWIQRYSNDILQTCVLYLSDHALAEDALQDTWINVFQCLQHQKVPVIHEKVWIMRIAMVMHFYRYTLSTNHHNHHFETI